MKKNHDAMLIVEWALSVPVLFALVMMGAGFLFLVLYQMQLERAATDVAWSLVASRIDPPALRSIANDQLTLRCPSAVLEAVREQEIPDSVSVVPRPPLRVIEIIVSRPIRGLRWRFRAYAAAVSSL